MHPVSPAGALVGRESEMTLLAGPVKEVSQGRGSSVLIEGEPGIGKSALVRAAVAEAPTLGCQVFWGVGDELGQALPLRRSSTGCVCASRPRIPGGKRSSGCCAVR
jgi:predicted ATP-dependent serine protease